MSEHSANCEHWHDEMAAYALDALEPRETAKLAAHLDDCSSCTERLRWLQPAVDVLPVTVAQQDPPAELRERLMATVRTEAAAADPAPAATPARRWRLRMPGFGEFGMRPALAGFGVALLLVAGVAGYALNSTDEGTTSSRTYEARSLDGNSIAMGQLVVNGDEGSLEVNGLPPNDDGEVYQAWIRNSADTGGSIEPSSVFVVAGDGTGTVAIPDGLEDAAEVMVTMEPEGGSKHPNPPLLIRAKIG